MKLLTCIATNHYVNKSHSPFVCIYTRQKHRTNGSKETTLLRANHFYGHCRFKHFSLLPVEVVGHKRPSEGRKAPGGETKARGIGQKLWRGSDTPSAVVRGRGGSRLLQLFHLLSGELRYRCSLSLTLPRLPLTLIHAPLPFRIPPYFPTFPKSTSPLTGVI